jgi:hypothetical protein
MIKDLGGLLRALPTPEPDPELRGRIVTSRAAGARVILPTEGQHVDWRFAVRVAAGIAAAVLLAMSIFPRDRENQEGLASSADAFWWASEAQAQEPGGKRYVASYPVSDLDRTRFGAGQWVFQSRVIIDGFTTDTITGDTITIAPGAYGGKAVWQIANRWGSRYFVSRDTLTVDRETLRPLRRAAAERRLQRPGAAPRAFEFPAGGSIGPLLLASVPAGYAGSQLQPFMRPALGLIHYLYLLPALQTLPIRDGWRGSVYVTWAWRDANPIPLDARVVGRETQTVPAGTFDCWKIELQVPSNKAKTIVWISTDRHWVVRMREPLRDGAMEKVLVAATPPAP